MRQPAPTTRDLEQQSAAATLTFSDSTRPASGIATSTSHCLRTSGRMPLPSAPSTSSTPPSKSDSHRAVGASATAAYAQSSGALHFGDEAGEVGHDSNRKVLDGTRRDATDGRRHARGAVRRQHEAGCTRALRAPTDGAEVLRIGDAVQADEQRLWPLGELVGVGVPVGLAEGDDALVFARARELRELALGSNLHAQGLQVAQPRFRAQGPLARVQLENRTRAAQRLVHRPTAVDDSRVTSGTSWKPSATSRTSQPSAAISPRNRSASSKSRARVPPPVVRPGPRPPRGFSLSRPASRARRRRAPWRAARGRAIRA